MYPLDLKGYTAGIHFQTANHMSLCGVRTMHTTYDVVMPKGSLAKKEQQFQITFQKVWFSRPIVPCWLIPLRNSVISENRYKLKHTHSKYLCTVNLCHIHTSYLCHTPRHQGVKHTCKSTLGQIGWQFLPYWIEWTREIALAIQPFLWEQ